MYVPETLSKSWRKIIGASSVIRTILRTPLRASGAR
jgi:hypothetical protein